MKNIVGLIITSILFIGICIGAYYIHNNANNNYNELEVSTLQDKIDDNESFALFIQNSELASSKNFATILKLVAEEYNAPVYYVDIADLNDTQFAVLFNIVSIDETPTLAYINNGVETDANKRVVDYVDKETTRTTIINSLADNGYLTK